jgi:hypothetical protein
MDSRVFDVVASVLARIRKGADQVPMVLAGGRDISLGLGHPPWPEAVTSRLTNEQVVSLEQTNLERREDHFYIAWGGTYSLYHALRQGEPKYDMGGLVLASIVGKWGGRKIANALSEGRQPRLEDAQCNRAELEALRDRIMAARPALFATSSGTSKVGRFANYVGAALLLGL